MPLCKYCGKPITWEFIATDSKWNAFNHDATLHSCNQKPKYNQDKYNLPSDNSMIGRNKNQTSIEDIRRIPPRTHKCIVCKKSSYGRICRECFEHKTNRGKYNHSMI